MIMERKGWREKDGEKEEECKSEKPIVIEEVGLGIILGVCDEKMMAAKRG